MLLWITNVGTAAGPVSRPGYPKLPNMQNASGGSQASTRAKIMRTQIFDDDRAILGAIKAFLGVVRR